MGNESDGQSTDTKESNLRHTSAAIQPWASSDDLAARQSDSNTFVSPISEPQGKMADVNRLVIPAITPRKQSAIQSPRPAQLVMPLKSLEVFPSSPINKASAGVGTTKPKATGNFQSPSLLTGTSERSKTVSNLVDSIRSQTLLDIPFMRNFSHTKTKPIEQRNLSKLSMESVYSLKMKQMGIQKQRDALTSRNTATIDLVSPSPPPPALGALDTTSTSTSNPKLQLPISGRHEASHRRLRLRATSQPLNAVSMPQHSHDKGSSPMQSTDLTMIRRALDEAFPQGEPCKPSSVRKPVTKKDESTTSERPQHKRQSVPRSHSMAGKESNPDLTEFETRKCHPRSIVNAYHGFLKDQDIQELMKTTGYTRAELYALWARFKALCCIAKSPQGVDKDTFRRGVPSLSVEDQFFIDRVFDMLDSDRSGILEWKEFLEALSALEKGGLQSRVEFLFRVYDLNGDGLITRKEVTSFFESSLLVTVTQDIEDVARTFVEKIFVSVGCGDKESIKIEDALNYMKQHPDLSIYGLFGRTLITETEELNEMEAEKARQVLLRRKRRSLLVAVKSEEAQHIFQEEGVDVGDEGKVTERK